MRPGKNYVPCLRWKQGEYLAIEHLFPKTKNAILPLIEVPEIGYDFEKKKDVRSLDDHLSLFTHRLKSKWGRNECFVDMHIIDISKPLANGQHPASFVFDDLRSKGIQAIPVIWIKQDSDYQSIVRDTILQDNRGMCVRISLEETADPNLGNILNTLLKKCKAKFDETDLILDVGAASGFELVDGFTGFLETTIGNLPYLDYWRSFGLIGTSFPSSLSGIKSGVSFIPRTEWVLYKKLKQILQDTGIRVPTFGDYVINHPEVLTIDPRFTKPKANVRYALSNGWLIVRGENVRDYGFAQHKDLCRLIVNSKDYYGRSFSPADTYIDDCAKGKVSTGNLSTWRQIGTNHHLQVVTQDIANLV